MVTGLCLLAYGINATDSFADRVSDTFTGQFTDRTTQYIIGGAGVSIIGLLMLTLGKRSK